MLARFLALSGYRRVPNPTHFIVLPSPRPPKHSPPAWYGVHQLSMKPSALALGTRLCRNYIYTVVDGRRPPQTVWFSTTYSHAPRLVLDPLSHGECEWVRKTPPPIPSERPRTIRIGLLPYRWRLPTASSTAIELYTAWGPH